MQGSLRQAISWEESERTDVRSNRERKKYIYTEREKDTERECIKTSVTVTVAALVVATLVAASITALVARGRKAVAAVVTAAVAALVAGVSSSLRAKKPPSWQGIRRKEGYQRLETRSTRRLYERTGRKAITSGRSSTQS